MMQACIYLGAITPYHGTMSLTPEQARRVRAQVQERKMQRASNQRV